MALCYGSQSELGKEMLKKEGKGELTDHRVI